VQDGLTGQAPVEWDPPIQPWRAVSYPRVATIRWSRLLFHILSVLVALYVAATGFRIYARKYYLFLPDYVRWASGPRSVAPTSGTTHIFLLFVDHFEPDFDVDRTEDWAQRYAALAVRHHDSQGRPPQHTWFFPGEQTSAPVLRVLQQMVAAGFGEVELHYHHDNDTADSLRPKLRTAIEDMQRFGFLKTATGETRFAFIHGDFGLDNGNGTGMCGVNDEIRLLRELGCFGDFTFPSIYLEAQPPIVNSIYAARDDPGPKSYAHALPLIALRSGNADLMMFEGPLLFAPAWSVRRLFVELDDGDIHPVMPASPARVERWIRANVHVPERPDWIFLKIFAHGASTPGDTEEIVGPHFDETLSYLETHYNDGQRFRLHYVTARQAYNLAISAAEGAKGDPDLYLDTPIPPYAASLNRAEPVQGARN
jgi:hypothetical protein